MSLSLCSRWRNNLFLHLFYLFIYTTGPCSQWCPVPNWGCVLSVTLLTVDLLQFFVCCIRSGVTWCTRLMMIYQDHICQCGLHAVPWWHIGILMRHVAADSRSSERHLFFSQCPTGTILLTTYSTVWDWPVSRAGSMIFYWPKLHYPSYSLLLFFPFSSFRP